MHTSINPLIHHSITPALHHHQFKNQKSKIKNRMKSINSPTSLITTMLHKPEPPKPSPCADRPTGLRRSALLRLAFVVNSLADSPSETELPLPAVHAAAQEGRLLELLAQSAGRYPDFSFVESPPAPFHN